MNLLLDTHVFLWWLADDHRLSEAARDTLMSPKHTVWVSVISAWEINIKIAKGKLKMEESISSLIEQEGFRLLPLGLPETERISSLPMHHQDPFDRMLISQSLEHGVTLVTGDAKILQYSVPVLDCRKGGS
jgi:PIN domain nuclease of toxin-antitoxin system